jgi:hypothetical protein
MTLEQAWRYAGASGLIVFPALAYGLMHWRLGRKRPAVPGEVPFPPDYSAIPGFPGVAQRFLTRLAPMFKWWVPLLCILVGIAMLIDTIHHG